MLISWFQYTLYCRLWWQSKDGCFLTVIAIFNKNKLLLHQFFSDCQILQDKWARSSYLWSTSCWGHNPVWCFSLLLWHEFAVRNINNDMHRGLFNVQMGSGVLVFYVFPFDNSGTCTILYTHKKIKVLTCIADEFLTRWEKRPSQRPHWYASSLDCWCFPLIAGL